MLEPLTTTVQNIIASAIKLLAHLTITPKVVNCLGYAVLTKIKANHFFQTHDPRGFNYVGCFMVNSVLLEVKIRPNLLSEFFFLSVCWEQYVL